MTKKVYKRTTKPRYWCYSMSGWILNLVALVHVLVNNVNLVAVDIASNFS